MTNICKRREICTEFNPKLFQILKDLFTLLDFEIPKMITAFEMKKVFRILKSLKAEKKVSDCRIINEKLRPMEYNKPINKSSKALIISSVGFIRFQLRNILNQNNFETFITDNLYNGMAKFITSLPDIIVFDADEKMEDLIVILEEIKRINQKYHLNLTIILLAPASFNNKKERLFDKGITNYIEKQYNWYQELEEILKNKLNRTHKKPLLR